MNKQITDIKQQAISDINELFIVASKAMTAIADVEDEFQVGDWLEFSDAEDFRWTELDRLEEITNKDRLRFSTKTDAFVYARCPYDRIIPHDGGEMPEWLKGKKVTVWYNNNIVATGVADATYRNWPKIIEYRVHKGESE